MASSAACDSPAAVDTRTALAAALGRVRRQASRSVAFVAVLCLAIALLLTAIDGRGFGYKLVYSFAVGGCCFALTDLTRLAAAALTDRLRAWRGLPTSPSGFGSGWRGIVPALVVAVVLGPPMGLWLADSLTGYSSPGLLQLGSATSRITLAVSLLGTLISLFGLSTMERLANARAQAEAAQRLAAENQLRLLQSQLEPHMLFNTLANLRVLIGLDAARAQAMLDHLIAFLRTTLAASRQSSQPLATEFQHLADYLALMAVRMGSRLAVQLDLPAELSAVPVPPLLLQPLVENAIQHGLEPQVAGGRIEVRARREGAVLRLTVRDTGAGLAAAATAKALPGPTAQASTFGLEQVRARLAALYGGRADFSLAPAADADGGTLAALALPMEPASPRLSPP